MVNCNTNNIIPVDVHVSQQIPYDYNKLANKPEINGQSLTGDVNIAYNDLENKPQISGVTLQGDVNVDTLLENSQLKQDVDNIKTNVLTNQEAIELANIIIENLKK